MTEENVGCGDKAAKVRGSCVPDLWRDILEKDDRTSPAEYPDMALITYAEFEASVMWVARKAIRKCEDRDSTFSALGYRRACQEIAGAIESMTKPSP